MQDRNITLTVEEGNILLQVASRFAMPEKLGDTKYSPAEQALANAQVGKFYRDLKRQSPHLRGKKRALAFGPEEAWESTKAESGDETFRILKHDLSVTFPIKRDSLNGLTWVLVLVLHPASPLALRAGTHEDVAWPVAEKIGRVRMIQDEIKLDASAKSPWDGKRTDEDIENEAKAKEPAKDTGPSA